MRIRCKKTRRFLIDIRIEDYLKALEDLGISQEIPLKIILPCPQCHKQEEYDIYKEHYVFVKNIQR